MLMMLRHMLAILLMPFVVVVGMPYWLLRAFPGVDLGLRSSWLVPLLSRWTGAVLGLSGFMLFIWCVSLFARIGKGTLAPWDPTKKLVTTGPYRLVRNPMISGVAMMLVGQALFQGSWVLGIWAGLFFCINHVYFVLSEEPGLEKRFGEDYRMYKMNVSRWIPKK